MNQTGTYIVWWPRRLFNCTLPPSTLGLQTSTLELLMSTLTCFWKGVAPMNNDVYVVGYVTCGFEVNSCLEPREDGDVWASVPLYWWFWTIEYRTSAKYLCGMPFVPRIFSRAYNLINTNQTMPMECSFSKLTTPFNWVSGREPTNIIVVMLEWISMSSGDVNLLISAGPLTTCKHKAGSITSGY